MSQFFMLNQLAFPWTTFVVYCHIVRITVWLYRLINNISLKVDENLKM